MEMMTLMADTTSIVRPQKYMKPPTLAKVISTLKTTMVEAKKSAMSTRVARNTQSRAKRMLRIWNLKIERIA